MLEFARLDTGQTLTGTALFDGQAHALFPVCAQNAVRVPNPHGRLVLAFLCAAPVHVLTFPANDDEAHMRASVVIH